MAVEFVRRMTRLGNRLPLWGRYAATAGIVLACFLADRLAGEHGLLCLLAILICSFLFRRGSGFVAIGLATLLFALQPLGLSGPGFDGSPRAHLPPLLVLAVSGLLVAGLAEALCRSMAELTRTTEALRSADARKSLMLEDINHRIKNHLASISMLLARSGRKVDGIEEARNEFKAAAARIAVLAKVYDSLQTSGTQTTIAIQGFVESLCRNLHASVAGGRPITIKADADDVELGTDRAVALGLLINELVQNALKYAFPDDRPGEIKVEYKRDGGGWRLIVADDGVGGGNQQATGLGQRLVRAIVADLGASISWHGPPGTQVHVMAAQEPGFS